VNICSSESPLLAEAIYRRDDFQKAAASLKLSARLERSLDLQFPNFVKGLNATGGQPLAAEFK
jgi:hypothetical protein